MSYQFFLESLTQLEADQSFFESMLGTELQGVRHEDLVRLGGKMSKKARLFASKGQSFADQLQPDFIVKIIEAIQDYQILIMPPKVFGGFCPCLKPAREGPEYDKKFLASYIKVVSTIYVTQAVLLENTADQMNMDAMHFGDYANRMNTLHSTLGSISTNGNEKAREGCRIELLASVEAVNRFLKSFDTDTEEFKAESKRRLSSTNELLSSPGGQSIGRRVLVKAQNNLQEIMNTAAMVSMKKARDSLNALEVLAKELKSIRDTELAAFVDLEPKMKVADSMDLLHRLKEDSEVIHNDANSKIRDSIKKWTAIKNQSNARPVSEFREEATSPQNTSTAGTIS